MAHPVLPDYIHVAVQKLKFCKIAFNSDNILARSEDSPEGPKHVVVVVVAVKPNKTVRRTN